MDGSDTDAVERTGPDWPRVDWALALKPEDVAKRLGVSTRYVYGLIKREELRPVKLAGRHMILSEDLDEFIARLKRERDVDSALDGAA